ncbi:MAG: ATPase [uncultured bacterium]|nr:MAG: ATPase [uncultured bacterium]
MKTQEKSEKEVLLANLVSDYLEKDVSDFLKLDAVLFNKLLNLASYQIGNLINAYELSRVSGASIPTVNKYLKIQEETYISGRLLPFFGSRRREFSHNPKYFFIDTGLRNCLIGNFSPLSERGDAGAIVENFIWSELVKHREKWQNFHFWRTRSQAEVDFVLQKADEIISIEVKFQEMKMPKVSVSLMNFIKRYSPKQAFIITKDFIGQREEGGVKIEYIPAVLIHELIDKLNL